MRIVLALDAQRARAAAVAPAHDEVTAVFADGDFARCRHVRFHHRIRKAQLTGKKGMEQFARLAGFDARISAEKMR